MTTRLLIIGGSDAGISAGLRAREWDPRCEVTIVMADRFPNYSICGLPFYLSGEVPDWHWLALRTAEDITREGIHLLLDHMAQAIDPANHLVTVADRGVGRRASWRMIAWSSPPVRCPCVLPLQALTSLGCISCGRCRTVSPSMPAWRPTRLAQP